MRIMFGCIRMHWDAVFDVGILSGAMLLRPREQFVIADAS